MKMRVLLSAPTGRAAKRISESTGHEACTVHRMLEMEYSEGREPVYKKNENDTLDADVIIVDESSMIDILLMNALCKMCIRDRYTMEPSHFAEVPKSIQETLVSKRANN